MTKTITIGAFATLGLLGLMMWGWNNQAARPVAAVKTAEGSLVAPETFYDFGTISMANGNVDKKFTITNPTNTDIIIARVETSCMCTAAYIESGAAEKGPFGMPGMGHVPPANVVVKAGESVDIKVVYDPNAHGPAGVGPIDRFVAVTDESGGVIELEIKAVVTP